MEQLAIWGIKQVNTRDRRVQKTRIQSTTKTSSGFTFFFPSNMTVQHGLKATQKLEVETTTDSLVQAQGVGK